MIRNELGVKNPADELELNFTGVQEEGKEDSYKYTLTIKYGDKEIENDFFNDSEHYRIWSDDHASTFTVYTVDSVYILDSYIASQCDGHEVMIFNSDGEVLKTFTNVTFEINESNIKIEDADECLLEDATAEEKEEHIKVYNYGISESQLVEEFGVSTTVDTVDAETSE